MARKTILIVEDDEDLLRGLSVRLSASGYRVVSATDAISATSVAKKEEPDLAILDIGIPGGDAFIVMERLKKLTPVPIPVIILTGRDPLIEKERAFEAGAIAFFQKPANNNELLAIIRRWENLKDKLSREQSIRGIQYK
jgi:DNA-binding response OmpR family regulator